ncbi:trimethylguanosine synthase [Phtheirospermum japonicum]|uniref:Trimethylguanosine synthase n=1 Tax=Phtheirospermum japonicum TaxID=374723 RepID=A0A830C0S9_9LAMI|nr:trimethylguanosine synthase [Phtheirospermum japonicum]
MDFSVDESPAVKALGPLFNLTEVHLWDDGSSEVRELAYLQEPVKRVVEDKDFEKSSPARFNGKPYIFMFYLSLIWAIELLFDTCIFLYILGFSSIPEDIELAKALNDLGLPLSFHTNKETRHGVTSGKRKGTRKNNQQSHFETDGYMEENRFSASLTDTSKMLDQYEILKNGIKAEIDGLSNLYLERGDSVSSTACTSCLSNEHDYNGEISSSLEFDHSIDSEGNCLINEVEIYGESDTLLVINHETEDQSQDIAAHAQFSEQDNSNMVAYWDDFYKRTYFYNVETGESTWDPPVGMEHLVCGNIADEQTYMGLAEQMDLRKPDEVQESRNDDGSLGNGLFADNVSAKRKKKVRRTKLNKKLSILSEDFQGYLQEVTPSICKYWCQRYLLFSRFDYGIQMDEEGWFSVTPEPLAKHHAVRCGNGTIVDFFTGVGGNAIQFAQRSKHVIAIDIDPNKINYARHNAAIYEVDDNIDFIKGDSFSLAPKLQANTVFMSPPWGGPDYSKVKTFDINTMLKPRDGQFLFDAGKTIAPKIVMFLPRNVNINQLAELSLSATPPWSLEVEMNYLNGRLKAITAYFSETSI